MNIVKIIKATPIRWLGHIFRYDLSRQKKKITVLRIEGIRRKARPTIRWLDCMEKEFKLMEIIHRWRAIA